MEKLEYEVEKYIKDSLIVDIVIKKANKIKLNGNKNLMIAEIDSWKQKERSWVRRKSWGIYINNRG